MKYITKPCEIEAVEWTGKNAAEILQFTNTENVNIVFGIPVISTFNGEMEGVLCRNCCNFTTIAVDGKHHCKCKAYGITREANTNWRSKYEACGLYNTPTDEKYKPIFKGVNE